jgi:hypothetical protein
LFAARVRATQRWLFKHVKQSLKRKNPHPLVTKQYRQ